MYDTSFILAKAEIHYRALGRHRTFLDDLLVEVTTGCFRYWPTCAGDASIEIACVSLALYELTGRVCEVLYMKTKRPEKRCSSMKAPEQVHPLGSVFRICTPLDNGTSQTIPVLIALKQAISCVATRMDLMVEFEGCKSLTPSILEEYFEDVADTFHYLMPVLKLHLPHEERKHLRKVENLILSACDGNAENQTLSTLIRALGLLLELEKQIISQNH